MQNPIREDADRDLVERCKTGDREAFRDLVAQHERTVFSAIATMVNDPHEADDIAQEVFIKVHRSLKSFKGQSRFSVWLYRIAINQCLDHIKHRKLRPEGTSLESLKDQDDQHMDLFFKDPSPDGAEMFENDRLRNSVRWVVASLSPDHRAVIALKDLEGYSQDEIAEILDCPVGTVKSRLTRAREALKVKLRPFYDAWRQEGDS